MSITLHQVQKRLDKGKRKEVKFEQVPAGQVTEKQAKEVVERMRQGLRGFDPLGKTKKVPFWKRPFKRIKAI